MAAPNVDAIAQDLFDTETPTTTAALRQRIIAKAQSLKLDPALALSLAHQESRFNPAAKSPTDVEGLFMVTNDTGKRYGQTPQTRTDPDVSMDVGLRHFKDLLDEAGGNVKKALMRYNGGSDPQFDTNVLRWYPLHAGMLAKRPQARNLMSKVESVLFPPNAEAAAPAAPAALDPDAIAEELFTAAMATPAPLVETPAATAPPVQAAAGAVPAPNLDDLTPQQRYGSLPQTLLNPVAGQPDTLEYPPVASILIEKSAEVPPLGIPGFETQQWAPSSPEAPASVPTPPATGTPGLRGSLKRTIGGGATQGLITTLGLPADLLTLFGAGAAAEQTARQNEWAMIQGKDLPAPVQSITVPGGTADVNQAVRGLLAKAGVDVNDLLTPQGGTERFIQAVVREATGVALPVGIVGSLGRLAGVSVRSIPALARFFGPADMSVLDAIAGADLGQIARLQALYGAAAGAGGEVATAVGGDRPEVRGIGQLLGGLTPDALKATAGLLDGIRTALRRASGNRELLQGEVDTLLEQTLRTTPGAVENLERAGQVQQAVPGVQPTLGQASGSGPILQTERALTARANPAAAARVGQQAETQTALRTGIGERVDTATAGADVTDLQTALRQQRAAAEQPLTQAETQAHAAAATAEAHLATERQVVLGEAAAATTEAQRRVASATEQTTRRQTQMQARLDQAQQQADAEAARLRQTGTPVEKIDAMAGERVRQAVQHEAQQARTTVRTAYNEVDPTNAVMGTLGDTYADLKQLSGQVTEAGGQVPSAVTRVTKAMEARAAREKGALPTARTDVAEKFLPDADLELQKFIVDRQGGIARGPTLPDELEGLASVKETGGRGLIRNKGLSLDAMAQAAHDAGFIDSPETRDLLEAIRESQRTGAVFSKYNSRIDTILGEFFDNPAAADLVRAGSVTAADVAQTPVTFMEMHRLRSELLTAQREATDPNTARVLRQAVDRVDRKMSVMAEESGMPDVLDRYQAAADLYKRTVVPFYRPGPGAEVLARQNGVWRVPNENVMERFWHSGGQGVESDANAFIQLIGHRQEERDALETFAMHDLYMSAAPTGRLDLKAAERWRQKHERLLAIFPDVEARFRTTRDLQQRVLDVQTAALGMEAQHQEFLAPLTETATTAARSEQAVQRAVQPGARPVVPEGGRAFTPEQQAAASAQQRLAPQTAALTQAQTNLAATQTTNAAQRAALDKHVTAQLLGDDPQQKLEKLLSMRGLDQRRALLDMATTVQGDPQAVRGLVRGLWDAYATKLPTDAQGLPAMTATTLKKFVDQFAPVLSHAAGADFVDDLRVMVHGLTMAERKAAGAIGHDLTKDLPGVTGVTRALTRTLPLVGGTVAGVASHIAGIPSLLGASSGIAGLYVGNRIAGWLRQGGETRVRVLDELFQEALFNPDIAKTVRMLRDPMTTPQQIAPRLYIHQLYLGQGAPGEQDRMPTR